MQTLPAASASNNGDNVIVIGIFHGVIINTTPRGLGVNVVCTGIFKFTGNGVGLDCNFIHNFRFDLAYCTLDNIPSSNASMYISPWVKSALIALDKAV